MDYAYYALKILFMIVFGFLFLVALRQTIPHVYSLLRDKRLNLIHEGRTEPHTVLYWGEDNQRIFVSLGGHVAMTTIFAILLIVGIRM